MGKVLSVVVMGVSLSLGAPDWSSADGRPTVARAADRKAGAEPTAADVRALVGLEVSKAERIVRAKGWKFRVVARDGVWLPITDNLRRDRVNVEVKKGKVVHAHMD
jgi:hypothetical protein